MVCVVKLHGLVGRVEIRRFGPHSGGEDPPQPPSPPQAIIARKMLAFSSHVMGQPHIQSVGGSIASLARRHDGNGKLGEISKSVPRYGQLGIEQSRS